MAGLGPTKKWGIAWISLVLAIALHVVDEATTDFLPFYNSIVDALRESYAWVPLPTFTFATWITGLTIGVLVLLGLSPLAFAGRHGLRPFAYFLSVLMVANALGHIAASVYLRELAPGVYSSPILLVAAVVLLIKTYRVKKRV